VEGLSLTMKVVFCVPTLRKPHPAMLDALEKSVPLIAGAGWDHGMTNEIGNVYISCARAVMTSRALKAGADVVVYIDHDMSWQPSDLLTLIETPGDVVCGTYRYKDDTKHEFMGVPFTDAKGVPITRADGCIAMKAIPAGFLKVTRGAIETIKDRYPELIFGRNVNDEHLDLFHHGAHKDVWFGEDYAFARRWNETGNDVWCIPTLNLVHHSDTTAYGGTYHDYLCSLPGGSEHKKAAA